MPDRYGESPDDGPAYPMSDFTLGEPESAIDEARDYYRARATANCRLCDDNGYRGSTVCDHIDHAEASKRGMAMIREAMGWDS